MGSPGGTPIAGISTYLRLKSGSAEQTVHSSSRDPTVSQSPNMVSTGHHLSVVGLSPEERYGSSPSDSSSGLVPMLKDTEGATSDIIVLPWRPGPSIWLS